MGYFFSRCSALRSSESCESTISCSASGFDNALCHRHSPALQEAKGRGGLYTLSEFRPAPVRSFRQRSLRWMRMCRYPAEAPDTIKLQGDRRTCNENPDSPAPGTKLRATRPSCVTLSGVGSSSADLCLSGNGLHGRKRLCDLRRPAPSRSALRYAELSRCTPVRAPIRVRRKRLGEACVSSGADSPSPASRARRLARFSGYFSISSLSALPSPSCSSSSCRDPL